jgi:RNA polymerase sigma-70 factor (ECF subfamily)
VRNAAIDLVKRKSRYVNFDPEYIFCSRDNPRHDAEQHETQRRIKDALMTLKEDERETIVMHIYSDLTFNEIAEICGRPLGTISSWYKRGLEKMRGILEEQ